MCVQHTFGFCRRPRRIVRDVHVVRAQLWALIVPVPTSLKRRKIVGALWRLPDHDPPQVVTGLVATGRVVHRPKTIRRNNRSSPRGSEDLIDFGSAVDMDYRQNYQSDLQARVVHHRPFDPVRQLKGHDVSWDQT